MTGPLVGLALATVLAVAPAVASSFPDRIGLPDGWQPEGVTSDGTTLYVGSLVDGAIWRGSLKSGTGDTFIPGVVGQMAVGIDFDAEHDRIWVAGGGGSSVRVYDATTGELLETYTFESGFVNDIVATEDAVYATDSNIQQLLVVPLGPGGSLPAPDDAFTLPLTGDITYVANAFNANGIAWARGKLVIVQSVTGLVFTVDSDGVASQVELRDESGEYLVTNGDGIEIRGSTLAVVRNFDNLVATFKLNGRLTSGVLTDEITSDDFAIPTTATWAAGDLWVANARFDVQPPPRDLPYWVSRVPGL
jgi:sugar lactone lactonase YvrE